MKKLSRVPIALPLGLLVVLAAGCAPLPASDVTAAPSSAKAVTPTLTQADAGMPVKAGDFAVFENKGVVAVRDDPFSLLPSEKSYEHEQTAQNLAAMTGHFPMFYEAPPEIDTTPEVEPQPYRRLAGIIIGDSVTALIDLGNGQIMEIHPGQRIPGTEWQVLSIDSEKAVLRRVGSRKLPSEVVVRLESPPPGAQPAPSGNPTNNAPANNGPLNSPTPGTGGARGD